MVYAAVVQVKVEPDSDIEHRHAVLNEFVVRETKSLQRLSKSHVAERWSRNGYLHRRLRHQRQGPVGDRNPDERRRSTGPEQRCPGGGVGGIVPKVETAGVIFAPMIPLVSFRHQQQHSFEGGDPCATPQWMHSTTRW
jgi:hypothetical protein